MTQRLRRSALAVAAVAAAMSGARPATADDDKVIKIAVELPFTGPTGSTANRLKRGFELAIEQANTESLPGGWHLATKHFDYGENEKVYSISAAEQNARDSVPDPRILIVFGGFHSAAEAAMIPIWNAAELASVSSVVSTANLTRGAEALALRKERPNEVSFFRMSASSDYQASAAAQFAQKLGYKNVFIVDDNDLYGKTLAGLFDVSFRAAGGNVIKYLHTTLGQTDYTDVIAQIKEAKPDMVFFGALGGPLANFRVHMGKAGLANTPLFAGNAMAEQTFVKKAYPYDDGAYFTFNVPDNAFQLTTQMAAFNDTYRRRYHEEPGPWQFGGYVAGQVEVAALRTALVESKGELPTRDAVRRAIVGFRGLPTAIGPVTFDQNGDIVHPHVSLYQWGNDEKMHFVDQMVIRNY